MLVAPCAIATGNTLTSRRSSASKEPLAGPADRIPSVPGLLRARERAATLSLTPVFLTARQIARRIQCRDSV
jgi:hypothetical protein